MNDKLQNLMDLIQRTAYQAGDIAADAAYGAGKKAEELLSAAKLRVRAATVEGEISERMAEVGKMVYATHTGTPTESETLLAKLQEIDELKARLAGINELLGRTEEPDVCPTCKAAVRDGDVFCRECGGKL